MWIFYPHNGCSEVANTFLRKDILVQKLGVVLVNDWSSPYHAYEPLNNSLDDHATVVLHNAICGDFQPVTTGLPEPNIFPCALRI